MLIELLLLLGLLCLLIYRWITGSFDKWKKEGLVHDPPSFPNGTHNILAGKKGFGDFVAEDYKKFKVEGGHKIHGWFMFGKPAISINDPELLKQIMVKDFNHFVDRNDYHLSDAFSKSGKLDQFWGHAMDSAVGDEWRAVRTTFTPVFTSGKMKLMLKFIIETSKSLVNFLQKKAEAGDEFELKDVYGRYSLDGLAACAFGVDIDSFKMEDESSFVKDIKSVFNVDALTNMGLVVKFIPGVNRILNTFNISLFHPKATNNIIKMIKNSLKERKQSKTRRNDLIDLMLDIMKNDLAADDEDKDMVQEKIPGKKQLPPISEDQVIAQALIFLTAGYDTTGTTLSFLTYALSKNQEVQERLRDEIDAAFEENDGELPDYAVIQGLPYLDMVIHETLRMYNPVGFNTRSCTEPWRIPGTDMTMKKGDLLTFSVMGLHRDPEHWSHPDQFHPEHFSKEEKAARHPYAFQAFGQGPRSCVGMRFALLEAKVAVMQVLRRFTFQPGTKTLEPVLEHLDPECIVSWPKGGLWVRCQERD